MPGHGGQPRLSDWISPPLKAFSKCRETCKDKFMVLVVALAKFSYMNVPTYYVRTLSVCLIHLPSVWPPGEMGFKKTEDSYSTMQFILVGCLYVY